MTLLQAPDLTVESLGAGVQSTALYLLACDGVLPKPDVAIWADTKWEPRAVYEHVARLQAIAGESGIPILAVTAGNIRLDHLAGKFASMPLFFRRPDGTLSMGQRQCTNQYKLRPINRKIRELLGAKAPDFKRAPKGRLAEVWIGFSTDEIRRVGGSHVSYIRQRHPLLDLGWSRKDCEAYLESKGWGETPKSACIGCPFAGNRQWRELRDQRPEEWADACAFDAAIRHARPDGEQYLHRSGVPLAEADLRTSAERNADNGQFGLFDIEEEGDPDGCGPYACRSGIPLGPTRLKGAA